MEKLAEPSLAWPGSADNNVIHVFAAAASACTGPGWIQAATIADVVLGRAQLRLLAMYRACMKSAFWRQQRATCMPCRMQLGRPSVALSGIQRQLTANTGRRLACIGRQAILLEGHVP